MAKGKRRYVRPGRIASEQYLQVRENQIRENNRKFEALGLHQYTCPRGEPSTTYGHEINETGRNRDEGDNYIPPDNDDEYSFRSSSDEVSQMPHARLSTRGRQERVSSTPVVREHPTPTVHEEAVGSTSRSLADVPATVDPTISESASITITRTRGPSRGLELGPGDVDRPQVPIPEEWHAPVGDNATRFASEGGCRVRHDLRNLHYPRWDKIPSSERTPIVESMKAKFDCVGLPRVVNGVINTKLAKMTRDRKYKLRLAWKNLVAKNSHEYARANPQLGCKEETWLNLIDHLWMNEKYQANCLTNSANRKCNKTNHSSGSKSFPVRAYEMIQKNGVLGHFSEFYKGTHYNAKKGKWATPDCEVLHNQMQKDEEEQASQTDAVPLTAEQMSIKHLRPRSGIVKGIGMRPSSSIRTTTTSTHGPNEEVVRLEQKMEEERQLMENKMEEQRQQLEAQSIHINTMMEYLKEDGLQWASSSPR